MCLGSSTPLLQDKLLAVTEEAAATSDSDSEADRLTDNIAWNINITALKRHTRMVMFRADS